MCCKGVLAGYPMVELKATLIDGSYHDVDSSEMAFKIAASLAYKNLLMRLLFFWNLSYPVVLILIHTWVT